jgi:hypothetical protein
MRTVLALVGGGIGYLLIVPVIVAGLPFWIVALLARALKPLFEPRTVPWNELIQFDPVVGWKPKPCLRAFCEAMQADIFYVETDEEGWSGPGSLDESPLVVFGDSFAFGYAANRPFFRVSASRLQIKAVAAQGYSMVQELMLMTQLAPRLRGKLVVWFIFPGNDLTDNLSPAMWGYRSPFVLQSDVRGWEIVTAHLQPNKWAAYPRYDRNKKLSAVFGQNMASDRVYSACEFLIDRGQAVCKQTGANLVVLTIPWLIQFDPLPWDGVSDKTLQPELPDRKLAEICKRLGVEFVPGKQYFTKSDFIPYEGHLNDKGHRRLAVILHDLYQASRASASEPQWSGSIPVCEEAGS